VVRSLWRAVVCAAAGLLLAGCASDRSVGSLGDYNVEHTTAVSNVTRVTFRQMAEINPEVSPDGTEVAFQGLGAEPGRGKHWEIWAVKTDTQHQIRRITDHDANSTDPAWAPDGKTIFFTAKRTMNKSIWEVASDGLGGVRQLTEDDRYNAMEPCVSIDKRVVYTVAPSNAYTQDSMEQLYREDYYLWLRDYDGANATEFVAGRTAKWSPDGRKLLFTKKSPDEDRCIWTVDSNGANLTQLTWHPDNPPSLGDVLFSIVATPPLVVYVAGQFLIGHCLLNDPVVDLDKKIHDVDPTWSPDGKKIAFSSNRASAYWERFFGSHNYDIWVMNADGSGLTQLTTYSKYEGHPTWSRDGDIYFFTCGGFFIKNWDIWRLTPRLIETGRGMDRASREVNIEIRRETKHTVPMPAPAPAAPAK
jgi:TolB protein